MNAVNRYNHYPKYSDIKVGDKVMIVGTSPGFEYKLEDIENFHIKQNKVYEVIKVSTCFGCTECPHKGIIIYFRYKGDACRIKLGNINGVEYKNE